MPKFRMPTLTMTTDIVIFTVRDERLEILLIQRGNPPYQGRWALPGGLVEEDEDLDVCARRECIDCHENVPMVRGCYENRIEVLLKHFTIIQVGSRYTVGPFLDGIAVRCIDVADGHDLVGADLVGSIKQIAHPAAGSDDSNANGIVCTQHSG